MRWNLFLSDSVIIDFEIKKVWKDINKMMIELIKYYEYD